MSQDTVTAGATAGGEVPEARRWQQRAARFRRSSSVRAAIQLATTLGPLAAVFVAMYLAIGVSVWITLALAPIAAGFLIRTFIIMHDCAHGSFTPSRRANEIIGFITGVVTMTPFAQWRRDHALHHASSGDLDRRGHGDVMTLTVEEYLAKDRWGRLAYRLYRHPLVLFGLGPLWLFIGNRRPPSDSAIPALHATGVHATNAALLVIGVLLALTLGIGPVLLVYLPAYFLAVVAGIWLFYVQHQFEGTYWETHGNWDYATAALRGSSYYRLPRVLEWMTGRIGLHHIHHIDPRIPNYELRRCHDETSEFREVPELTFWRSFRSVRLKLWDTERGCMVGFDAVHDAPSEGR